MEYLHYPALPRCPRCVLNCRILCSPEMECNSSANLVFLRTWIQTECQEYSWIAFCLLEPWCTSEQSWWLSESPACLPPLEDIKWKALVHLLAHYDLLMLLCERVPTLQHEVTAHVHSDCTALSRSTADTWTYCTIITQQCAPPSLYYRLEMKHTAAQGPGVQAPR